jgi:hypothetical protein
MLCWVNVYQGSFTLSKISFSKTIKKVKKNENISVSSLCLMYLWHVGVQFLPMNPKALKGRWRLELLEDEKMD